MNAVQIIHKHIMLRFCVVLLAVFVAFGAFTSTCFADDPLGRQITVAVGGTIGSGLGSLAGGSIAAAGVSAVGLPAAAPIASKVGSGLVGSAGGVVGGLFAGKLYDFLTGYGGDAAEENFETAYDSWRSTQGDMPSGVSGNWIFYSVNIRSVSLDGDIMGFKRDSFNGNSVSGSFTGGYGGVYVSPVSFIAPFDCSYIYAPVSNVTISSLSTNFDYWLTHGTVKSAVKDDTLGYDSLSFYITSGAGAGRFTVTAYYAIKANDYITSVPSFKSVANCRVGSVSSGVSVGQALFSAVGSSQSSVGIIDAPSPDDANNFYMIPLVDEDEKTLIMPDGSTVSYDDIAYDYSSRTYHITYDTSKNYHITYNYDNCVISDGITSNTYYYVTTAPDAPITDKDGNEIDNSGGSTTDPSNPDTPSGGDDDNSGSIWDKVVDAIAGLFTAIGKVIGGLLESVINLFTGIVDGLTGCLDLFGSFGEFVAGFYTWMPEEWRTVLAAAFTIFIGLAVVKLFRGS